ncbi:enoyl-CoA hydratase/isomerase family protein [Paraburkholderia sp. DHOC27]|uniref:enoyl-CoA hydratase/isomerase family protein n=1 Tax=Paraburkholderia sp. DHOC27 TaxID=2303330 RepID=UPI000E3E26F4|nr:enoyl-CoA hydratase/isomerase family protein [Paraburkholderia sp. DHOC27]RFU49665.1 enoyl-CoA hydratase/isomerase family protein [Paraburkholderia sp. DHOC27]
MTPPVHLAHRLMPDLDGFRVEFDETDARADIVLDRPPFNLVSLVQREQLRVAFEALDDDPAVRVIVIRAEGEHFSSGGSVEDLGEGSAERLSKQAWHMDAPARCGKPVIAANRGYCFGPGFELSLACDFRIATETTLYALPAQKQGHVADWGGTARLQKMVGMARTKDIVMRARRIAGPHAYDWGIASEFVVDSDLENMTDALVRELLVYSPHAQRAAKRLLNDIEDAPPTVAIELEGKQFSRLRYSDDLHEGLRAFRQKRFALFNGG